MTSRTEQKRQPDTISTEGDVGESRRVIKGIEDPLNDLVGTENQVILTPDGTQIIFSTPQDIDKDADVEFDSLTLGDLNISEFVLTDLNKKLVSGGTVQALKDELNRRSFFYARSY